MSITQLSFTFRLTGGESQTPKNAEGWECQAEGCAQPKCCSGLDLHIDRMPPCADP